MSLSVDVTGMDELHKAMKALGGREAKRARTNAARNAAALLARGIKAAAPVRQTPEDDNDGEGAEALPNALKDSVRVGKPFNGRGVSIASVKMNYYGIILNSGRDKKRGITFPHVRWIKRAAERHAQASIDKFTKDLWKQLANQWDKHVYKSGSRGSSRRRR